jgi:RND family efflux transporter MFP subunit
MDKIKKLLARIDRRLLIVPPVLLGVGIFWVMKGNYTEPKRQPVAEAARPLRVIEVTQVELVPRVLGHGIAQAGDVWSAVAEVKGRVVSVHPELKPGAIFRAGVEVLRVDPVEYELRIAQLAADVAEIKSQQSRLTAEEENYRSSLAIEQKSLALAKRDLARLEKLTDTSSVTRSEVERTERTVLAQQQSAQTLTNSLNTLPSQRGSLAAMLAAKQASLQLAELDLKHTTITAPFDCRVGELNLEVGQFLATGQTLFEAYGTDLAEVQAQIPINQVLTLLSPTAEPIDRTTLDMQTMREVFNVEATVRLQSGDVLVEWPAHFARVREQLDTRTRTVRIVVAVENPYENIVPGKRPPLAPGMFCQVEFRGQTRTGQIVIPRTALRDGHVYLVNKENRLERRAVKIAFSQGGLSCLAEGLKPGERLVVSDPTPAVEGMLVDPRPDEALQQSLEDEATGEGPVR